VVIKAVPAEALAQWLAQARGNARAVPREVHLTRAGAAAPNAPAAPAAAAAAPAAPTWDGTLVMGLPAAR